MLLHVLAILIHTSLSIAFRSTRCGTSSEYILASIICGHEYSFPANICVANIRTSASIGFGHDEYSQIFVGGYIANPGPIYAPYVDRTSNISPIRRISDI